MNKKDAANKGVRKKISNALFSLLKTKKFDEIKITEIVKEAQVARSSYYKNYSSKEDIIYDFAMMLNDDFLGTEVYYDFENLDYINTLKGFQFYLKYKEEFLLLIENRLLHIYIYFLNDLIDQVSGDMPANSKEKYNMYCYTGSLFNLILKWMENDTKETPEEITEIFIKYVRNF